MRSAALNRCPDDIFGAVDSSGIENVDPAIKAKSNEPDGASARAAICEAETAWPSRADTNCAHFQSRSTEFVVDHAVTLDNVGDTSMAFLPLPIARTLDFDDHHKAKAAAMLSQLEWARRLYQRMILCW